VGRGGEEERVGGKRSEVYYIYVCVYIYMYTYIHTYI
jgi:hypothetical protein